MCSNVSMEYRTQKHGYPCRIAKCKARLHDKVLLYMSNWDKHIRARHPEMTLDVIADILAEPDCVFKPSRNTKERYYQKSIAGTEYRVVIGHSEKTQRWS